VKWIRVERGRDGVLALTMDRPPVNALGRELVAQLAATLAELHADADARCLILRAGGGHFCAGADLKERQEMTLDEVRAFVPRLGGVSDALAALPYPTIAAVRGAAAGGGCELALACDFRVLAADAKIGLRETALAIIPGAGGTQRLPRLIGPARAKRWIFAAEMHSAERALADGVADRVVPAEKLDEAARELARAIAANGPAAVRLAKRAVDGGLDLALAEGLALEWDCYRRTLDTEDRTEALRAFAAKRPPEFKNR
jgi:enoyl-CoA hydratase/carnithine racemase